MAVLKAQHLAKSYKSRQVVRDGEVLDFDIGDDIEMQISQER